MTDVSYDDIPCPKCPEVGEWKKTSETSRIRRKPDEEVIVKYECQNCSNEVTREWLNDRIYDILSDIADDVANRE